MLEQEAVAGKRGTSVTGKDDDTSTSECAGEKKATWTNERTEETDKDWMLRKQCELPRGYIVMGDEGRQLVSPLPGMLTFRPGLRVSHSSGQVRRGLLSG